MKNKLREISVFYFDVAEWLWSSFVAALVSPSCRCLLRVVVYPVYLLVLPRVDDERAREVRVLGHQ
jgi:hypothetical protein